MTRTQRQREWRFLGERAAAAAERIAETGRLDAIRAAIAAVDLAGDQDALARQRASLSAEILRLVHPRAQVMVSFAYPYERLDPAAIPPAEAVTEWEIDTLAGEVQAVGLLLANGSPAPSACEITITGLDPERFALTVRKQAFVEEWYRKEEWRVADPLPRLTEEDGAWRLILAAGELAKLMIVFQSAKSPEPSAPGGGERAQEFAGTVRVRIDNGQDVALPLRVRVLPAALPPVGTFPFHMFARMKRFTAAMPDRVAKDLAEHRVSMLQCNVLPRATFSAAGEVLSIDFARHDELLDAYLAQLRRLFIFWQAYPFTDFRCSDGSTLEPETEPWQIAYVNLLKAWRRHVTERGYGPERFAHHVIEETASSDFIKAPDQRVLFLRGMAELTRSALPDATISATLCDYAFPADVRIEAPLADIVMVGLPYRTQLPRNAPPSYNPRKALEAVIWPYLETLRGKNGVELWSYHCQSGKRGDVLQVYLTWPVVQVANGMQGTSHWAYDDISGPSGWHDWDGRRLDFLFNYDGAEDHPLNRRLNPAGDPLVPSIRYEALRAGLQDAAILKHLKNAAEGKGCPEELAGEIATLLSVARDFEADRATRTHAGADAFARRLRAAYSACIRAQNRPAD